MRSVRLLAAAVVVAALSTLGATAAQAADGSASAQRVVVQYQGWQW